MERARPSPCRQGRSGCGSGASCRRCTPGSHGRSRARCDTCPRETTRAPRPRPRSSLLFLPFSLPAVKIGRGRKRPRDVRKPLLRSERDVLGLRAFCALSLFELDLRTLCEGLVAIAADGAEMDEHVLATGVGGDEAIPLCIVEPLNGSGCHRKTPPLPSENGQWRRDAQPILARVHIDGST